MSPLGCRVVGQVGLTSDLARLGISAERDIKMSGWSGHWDVHQVEGVSVSTPSWSYHGKSTLCQGSETRRCKEEFNLYGCLRGQPAVGVPEEIALRAESCFNIRARTTPPTDFCLSRWRRGLSEWRKARGAGRGLSLVTLRPAFLRCCGLEQMIHISDHDKI